MQLQTFQGVKNFWKMSKREKWLSAYSNLWMTPGLYTLLSLFLFTVTAWVDLWANFGSQVPSFLNPGYELTRVILSTLTAGLLSLTAFTFYGVLTALTTFSGQFSPRILKNFMLTKKTRTTLGVFIGSFLYVLLTLLFLNKEANYFFIPITATMLATVSLGAFVIFINHIVNWLQITTMTTDMRNESLNIIESSLKNELGPYRVEELELVKDEIPQSNGHPIPPDDAGYLQRIDFIGLIQEAKKDDIVIKLEYKVGNFVFSTLPMITYWKVDETEKGIDEEKYKNMLQLGKQRSEVQDIEYSLNKFVEIAIRALGNDDPKTATGSIYQLGELLINISQNSQFIPYLVDDQRNLRVMVNSMDFDEYLYVSFASLRHYSRKDIVITMELLKVLRAISQTVRERDYESVWEFVVYTVKGFEHSYLHNLDRRKFYQILWDIASITRNIPHYYELAEKTLSQIKDEDDLEEVKAFIYRDEDK